MTRHEWALLPTPQVPTLGSGMNSAALCNANGWKPGMKIAGDEAWGVTVLTITAIGEKAVLCDRILVNGKLPAFRLESVWQLHHRDWRRVPA